MRKFFRRSQLNVFDKLIELTYKKKNYGLLLIQQSFNQTFKQRTKQTKNKTRKNQ